MGRARLEELLLSVDRAGADALQLVPGAPPCMRIQGNLVRSTDTPSTSEEIGEIARDFLFADHRQKLARGEEVEVLYTSRQGTRFRTSIQDQESGLSLVFRRLPSGVPKLADLGLPDLVGGFTSLRSGIVLVAGFLGSGRSSTLAAMVDRVNQDSASHVVTLENPIEFLHDTVHALIVQRELGVHTPSYVEGIHDAVRAGADVLVVGEIPDSETLDAVLTAAEAGILVIAATNASSVVSGLSNLLALGSEATRPRLRARLSSSLRAMISQTLLQRTHANGRVPLVEVLINNPPVAEAIRGNSLQDIPAIMQKARGLGMQTVDAALKGLLSRTLISTEEALYHATDRDWVTARPAARAR